MNHDNDNILYIYCDGACVPNPGEGGWAALLDYNGNRKVIHGSVPDTTNNRMEIQAAIEAFNSIKPGWKCDILVVSDSQYLISSMTGEWKVKKNGDLFSELFELTAPHNVTWEWVKGHSGHPQNEIVDKLAEQEATRLFNAKKVAS